MAVEAGRRRRRKAGGSERVERQMICLSPFPRVFFAFPGGLGPPGGAEDRRKARRFSVEASKRAPRGQGNVVKPWVAPLVSKRLPRGLQDGPRGFKKAHVSHRGQRPSNGVAVGGGTRLNIV